MNAEFDYDLTLGQWEALKALRLTAPERHVPNRFMVENLVALQLAAVTDRGPVITSRGRSVLLRGSPLLLDLAA